MKTPADRIASAQAAFEAGFLSMAAKKRALDDLNRAYDGIKRAAQDYVLANRTPENEAANHELYWSIPMDLHLVRDRFFTAFEAFLPAECATLRDLIALRASIKDAEIAPAPAKPEIETKAEAIRRSITEELERRKTAFVQGLDFSRLYNEMFPRKDGEINLPVSINAHWVHGHKGAVFIRHFFYLHGRVTPLQTILAIADTMEREREGRS